MGFTLTCAHPHNTSFLDMLVGIGNTIIVVIVVDTYVDIVASVVVVVSFSFLHYRWRQ